MTADELIGTSLTTLPGKKADVYDAAGGNLIGSFSGIIGNVYSWVQQPDGSVWLMIDNSQFFSGYGFWEDVTGVMDNSAMTTQATTTGDAAKFAAQQAKNQSMNDASFWDTAFGDGTKDSFSKTTIGGFFNGIGSIFSNLGQAVKYGIWIVLGLVTLFGIFKIISIAKKPKEEKPATA